MRTSVIVVLLLSLAVLLWLARTEQPPIAAAGSMPMQTRLPAAVDHAAADVSAATAGLPSLAPPGATTYPNGDARLAAEQAVSAAPTSERDLLEDGAWVQIEPTLRLAATQEGFNKLLQMLASSSSVEIAQRQASYQNLFITDPLYLSGDLQVGQVTCGESVCAAFVTGVDAQQLSTFVGRLRASQRPPIYSLSALDAPAAANRIGKRLIFSINLVRDSKFSIRRRPR